LEWFATYIWRFKEGKAGTFLVVLLIALDLHSRIEIALKWLGALPMIVAAAHGWWLDPAILILGIGLIYRSTRKAKRTPRPRTLEERVKDQDEHLDGLEKRSKQIIEALGAVPQVTICLNEYGRLLEEATQLEGMFSELRKLYPSSPVALTPFSSTWRPFMGTEPPTEGIRDGVKWIRLLETHFLHVDDWCTRHGLYYRRDLCGQLSQCVAASKRQHVDVSGDEAAKLLSDHITKITALRDDYAAAVTSNFSAIATMSPD
jgi:hypothetical protein